MPTQPLILYNPTDGSITTIESPFGLASLPNHTTAIAIATQMYEQWLSIMPTDSPVIPRDNYLFQRDIVIHAVANTIRGINSLIPAGTGTGKTYMNLSTLDILFMFGYKEYLMTKNNLLVIPFPCVYVVNLSSVDQIKRDALPHYPHLQKQVFIINYEQLRARQSFASLLVDFKKVDDKTLDINNPLTNRAFEHFAKSTTDSVEIPLWNTDLAPPILLLDECQKLKNTSALQTQIVQSWLSIFTQTRTTLCILASATPFVRPSEVKTIALACKLATLDNYNGWLRDEICGPRIVPTDYSPAAMSRITDALELNHNIIPLPEIRFNHKTINKHVLIDFTNETERNEYNAAYTEWLAELAAIDKDAPGGMGEIFASILKFRQKASWIRRFVVAKIAHQQTLDGHNVIAGTCFTKTRQAIIDILRLDYGLSNISTIHGAQSKDDRWKNVNDFQDEKSFISINMMQAGGTGLSLHQYKGRNKRPRFVIMEPVWSIIEMLQMLGRAHRINSASTTHQWILWYRGTIEEQVASRLKEKAISARELLRRKEQWSDLFVKESERQYVKINMQLENKPSNLIAESDNEDDEQDNTWNSNETMIAQNLVTEG